MNYETAIEIVKWLGGTIVALLSTGGIVKLVEYFASRPENVAKARERNVTAETTLGEGWRAYAEKVEARFDELEASYRRQINALEKKIDDERKRHDIILERKDREISELKTANAKLTDTNDKLREQNHILRNQLQALVPAQANKVEEVKQTIHAHVDESLEELKPHNGVIPDEPEA